jgi:hypothetical protein
MCDAEIVKPSIDSDNLGYAVCRFYADVARDEI